MKSESASLSECPDVLIVAPPRQAKLQTIVFIRDAQAVTNRGIAVGKRQGIFVLAREVQHRGPENRPVAGELDPSREPKLLLVPQILNRRVDVAVEAQV